MSGTNHAKNPFAKNAALIAGVVLVLAVLLSGCLEGEGSQFGATTILSDNETPDGLHECEYDEEPWDGEWDPEEMEEWDDDEMGDLPEPTSAGYQVFSPDPDTPCEEGEFIIMISIMEFASESDLQKWVEDWEDMEGYDEEWDDEWDDEGGDEWDPCSFGIQMWGQKKTIGAYGFDTDWEDNYEEPDYENWTEDDWENWDPSSQMGDFAYQDALAEVIEELKAKHPGMETSC